ncbi:DinB family protein [Pseudochryseolinea flava]|uniref:DinB-like domain-containing protein n=1 Tax=Pseudochryseolinea flava TaxID=2059302 RepID=A0A364Y841_9BACT|nr:DinB family protein [Pseudochryseolinea flava]RAW03251.1 hypothetical protein DQQ10_03970 [Pseudochryseolinea flava]
MNAYFQKYFDLLEIERKILVAELRALSEEQRNIRIRGKWSINQLVAHLLTAERLSLLYMKKKSLGIDKLDDSGALEVLKMLLLKFSQRVPVFRFTAPKSLVASTPTSLKFDELILKWDDSRADLKKFLASIPSEHARKKIFKHHIAGRLDAAQAVCFLREHFRHHMPQVRRLLNSFH